MVKKIFCIRTNSVYSRNTPVAEFSLHIVTEQMYCMFWTIPKILFGLILKELRTKQNYSLANIPELWWETEFFYLTCTWEINSSHHNSAIFLGHMLTPIALSGRVLNKPAWVCSVVTLVSRGLFWGRFTAPVSTVCLHLFSAIGFVHESCFYAQDVLLMSAVIWAQVIRTMNWALL